MVFDTAVVFRKYLPDGLYRFLEVIYIYLSNTYTLLKCKLLTHKYLNKDNKKLYPKFLILPPTSRCNLSCAICDRRNVKPLDLSLENLQKIEEVIKHAENINFTGFGESLLNKEFSEILKYVFRVNKTKRIMTMVTNGTRLTREFGELVNDRLNAIDISINAATEETYLRDMKHSKLHIVLDNLRNFMSALDEESRSRVGLIFVAHSKNYKEMPDFIDLVHSMGIKKARISYFIAHDMEHVPLSLLCVKKEYNHFLDLAIKRAIKHNIFLYDSKFNSWANHNFLRFICTAPYTQLPIQTPDGNVNGPCCVGEFTPVNVFENDFESFWFRDEYKKLRKERYLPCCLNCRAYVSFDTLEAHFEHIFLNAHRDQIIDIINTPQ